MMRMATIVVVSLFVSGICFAPFAMAEPTEKEMYACNKAASKMHDAEVRSDFLKECLSIPIPRAEPQMKKACNKAASRLNDAEERKDFLRECLSIPPAM
jgi:hypothetical protein